VRKAGNYTRDCVSGAWAGYPLECQAPPAQACPRLSPPQHAQRAVCSGMTQGDVCMTQGDVCVAGAWTGTALTCVRQSCPELAPPAKAQSAACHTYAEGMTCLHLCAPGYVARGETTGTRCRGWGTR
jgi:hypothetical protein